MNIIIQDTAGSQRNTECYLDQQALVAAERQASIQGRTQEIQRLIGRSLRSATNLHSLEKHTVWIDCDVIQADGGTRTASITGGFVALIYALRKMHDKGDIKEFPVKEFLAAIKCWYC